MISKEKHIVLAGIFGNALEWYDFTVYAFFVPVLATLFFPGQDAFVSLLQTFGVFAIGFLIRPFGAVFFGYLGDYVGRRTALIISIIMMSFPTFCLGLLPTYNTIGLLAPILLTFLRLVQGLAVSGELTTATSFLVEHAPHNKRGVAGSLAMCSAFTGIAVSSAIASLVTEMASDVQLYSWGWRIPFLVGGLIGLIGLVVRLKTIEPALYQQMKEEEKALPSVWQHVFSLKFINVAMGVFLTATMGIGNYFIIGYFTTFLVKTQNLPLRAAMFINFASLTCMTILMPFMGMLSDRIGRKRVLSCGLIGLMTFSYPIFWLLVQDNIWMVLFGEMSFAMLLSPITAVIPTTLAEFFDTHNRNTGLSISYNFSLTLFGGTAPLVAMSLVAGTQSVFAPAWYVMIAASIGVLTLFFLTESYKKVL